jgi:hypothetical protein
MMTDDGTRKLEAYLNELNSGLRGMAEAERSEIIAELRSHVLDSAGEDTRESAVEAVIQRLGTPAELAAQYRTERLLTRAERSSKPWTLISTFFHWATLSFVGFFALMGLLLGYLLTACFLCAAVMKPFSPERVGLWILPGNEIALHLGFVAPPPPHPEGHEILGWWIIPLGLALACLAYWSTPRFARWMIRRHKNTKALR